MKILCTAAAIALFAVHANAAATYTQSLSFSVPITTDPTQVEFDPLNASFGPYTAVSVDIASSVNATITAYGGTSFITGVPISLKGSTFVISPGAAPSANTSSTINSFANTSRSITFNSKLPDLVYTVSDPQALARITGTDNFFQISGDASLSDFIHGGPGVVGPDFGALTFDVAGTVYGTITETFLVPEPSGLLVIAIGLVALTATAATRKRS